MTINFHSKKIKRESELLFHSMCQGFINPLVNISTKNLENALKDVKKLSETNCWYTVFQAKTLLKGMIKDELSLRIYKERNKQ